MKNELVLVDPQIRPGVALLRLNRPKELNALNLQLMGELRDALAILDKDENVRVMVLTGNEKAFAAGADIHQMSGKGAIDMLLIDQFATWEQIRRLKKPLIAAVSGFVLGGGNELVMHCDLVVASETARFGQPEILLGIMPGAGGTQRLTRQIGKVNAMEMVLTGQPIAAKQALAWGLVKGLGIRTQEFLYALCQCRPKRRDGRLCQQKAPPIHRFLETKPKNPQGKDSKISHHPDGVKTSRAVQGCPTPRNTPPGHTS